MMRLLPQQPLSVRHLRNNPAYHRRRDTFRITLTSVVVMAALLLMVPCRAVGQDSSAGPSASAKWHFGYEMFQMLLEEGGLKPVGFSAIHNNPKQSVIVHIGDSAGLAIPFTLDRFCQAGGRVLLASERGHIDRLRGGFHTGPVRALDSADRFRNFDDCIRITDIVTDDPLMDGVNSLVVNRAGWLAAPRLYAGYWHVAARLPDRVQPAASSGEPLIATVSRWNHSGGRLFTVADSSLFTNGMMWHGDNALFAINLSRELATDGRTQVMFVVNNHILPSYTESRSLQEQAPPPPPPAPDLDVNSLSDLMKLAVDNPDLALDLGNSIISRVEETNLFNEFIARRPRNLAPPYFRRRFLFALAATAIALAVWRLASPVPATYPVSKPRSPKSAHQLSSDAMVHSSELGQAAGILARDFCRELTGSSSPDEWHRQLKGDPVTGASRVRKKLLEKRLAPVLELALKPRTVHISRQRFQSIGQTILDLRKLHTAGSLLRPVSE